MWKIPAAAVAFATVLAANAAAQDAKPVIDDAARAMGASDLASIAYSGPAAAGNWGQSRNINYGLASTSIQNYSRAIDFTQPASLALGDTVAPAGRGEPRPAPRLGGYLQHVTSATPEWTQQMEIWLTPWGFLRGAAANAATVKSRKIDNVSYQVVTWSPAQKAPSGLPYQVAGYIGPDHLIHRVETWVEHPVMGDLHVEALYSGYRDAGGLKVPGRIALRQQGMESFVVVITEARANPSNIADLMTPPPAPARGPAPVAAPLASERLADGVYRISGGYVALAVELKDYVVVLEGGHSEARGLAILAETKRLFPAKRIKYVVNTHPHFDHAAGLPPFAAQGITILTDDNNKFFVEASLSQPRTLVGDTLAKARKKPKVEGVIDKLVLTDGARTIELHHVEKLEHSEGMLIAFLPKERILFTADFNVPAAGQPLSPSIATLVQNLERLQLDFERHVMVHPPNPDRPMTKADLLTLVKGAN